MWFIMLRMFRVHLKTRSYVFILIGMVTVTTIFLLRAQLGLTYYKPMDRSSLLKHVRGLINSGQGKTAAEGQACRVPVLDVNATEILALLKNVPKVLCNNKQDWVEVTGSTAKIAGWVKKRYGDVECSFTEIIRLSDYKQYEGMTTTTHTEYYMESSDVVKVNCMAENGRKWNKVILGVRSDQEIFDRTSWTRLPTDSLRLNVLIFGFDSLSSNMWKRKLPKTYKYAIKDLKGIALNGYNIVGDGTPQALIPILTGRTELELPDTRKRMGKKAHYVNVYPFIWNDFQRSGYVTAWGEDMVNIGTFTYRLKGFQEQPVDHYMRTFYVEASPSFYEERPFCYGGKSRFQIMLDFMRNMYEVYTEKPKFIFCFHGEYTHDDINYASNADEDVYQWLKEFYIKEFASIRNTQQGKQEERLPGFMFVFPPWFEKKFPDAISNFKLNANRLTTPFDIYETLKNVLHYEGNGEATTSYRGISLFKKIPLSRTCQDAGIEPHWCSCLDWESIPVQSSAAVNAAKYLVKFINAYTKDYRDVCSELSLGEILWSARLLPNQFVLKFKKNSDIDGFVGDMSDSTKVTVETYEIKVTLNPGNMLFEASIKYLVNQSKYSVSISDISRTSKYKDMTHCIEDFDKLHQLRKFCYCL